MQSIGPIKNFTIGIYDGPHATPKPSNEGPIFLGIKNVTDDGRLDFEEIRHVSEAEFPKWTRRVKPQKDDIVFSYEATLHRYARIPDNFYGCLGRRMALVRPDRKKVDPRFLHYYFLSPVWRAKMEAITITGATVNRIPLTSFPGIKVSFPGLNEQVAISDILSAYDDLIENNRRRIALLEAAARLLYREWFVHFRFPGHEHVKIIDGLPEGWERSVPSGIIANHIGGGWGKDESQGKEGEPAFVIRGTDIPRVESGDISSVGLRFHSATSLRSRVLVPYDVVFEVSGGSSSQPIARTLLLTEERLKLWNTDVICASFCKRFTFNTATDALYFIFHIREHRDRGDVLVYQKESASSLKNFNFDAFMSSYEIPVPPLFLRNLFFESIDPIVRQQSVLAAQIQQLAKARDLLLPRLMNGGIAV